MFAQSSKPEARVKNARETKNTKQDKMWIMHIQIKNNLTTTYIVILGKCFKKLLLKKRKT